MFSFLHKDYQHSARAPKNFKYDNTINTIKFNVSKLSKGLAKFVA